MTEKLVRVKQLKKLQQQEQEKKESTHDEEEDSDSDTGSGKFVGPNAHVSLLDQHSKLKLEAEGENRS